MRMKKIVCNFKSNGEKVAVTAIISDDLSSISKDKRNQATDIIDDDMYDHEVWGLFFEMNDHLGYEIQFKVEKDSLRKTLKPVKAVTWEGSDDDSVITDVQKVSVNIK